MVKIVKITNKYKKFRTKMASSSGFSQAKVTDYYRKIRKQQSVSPKKSKKIISAPPAPSTATKTRIVACLAAKSSDFQSPAKSRRVDESEPLSDSESKTDNAVACLQKETPNFELPFNARIVFIPDNVSNLELPPTYNLLLDWFRSADQLVAIMYNRQELITFTKLQSGVQKTTRKNFGLKQLGQIKTVYPEAYNYEQQRITRQAGIMHNRRQEYELTLKPNLFTDLSAYGLQTPIKTPRKRFDVTPTKTPRTPTKRPYYALSPTRTPPKRIPPMLQAPDFPESPSKGILISGSTKPFSGGRLISRTQVFRRNLFGILHNRHKEFLGALSPPIQLNKDEERRLTSWHPKFLSDEQALDIIASDLPEAPVVDKVASAKDLLATSRATLHPKVAAAAASVADNRTEPFEGDTTTKSSENASKATSALALKGIPPKLLEKIREKERQKKQLAMLRSPEEETRRLRLSRLPDFVRIINMFFATEGKAVLHLELVHKKLADSYTSPLAAGEIVEHVKLLRELVPDFISQTDISDRGSYLRLNRDLDTSEVLKILGKQ